MKKYKWENYSDDRLLNLRFCDLRLKLVDTPIQKRVDKLYEELERKGLDFKPHFWLSNDWFTPEGIAGIAVPFYVAHPRLRRLEKKQVYEVEGGEARWFMKLLRHECGHAIENAYRLRRRKKRQEVFGKSSQPYSPYYLPKPYSKKFVLHLDDYYSQSHPDDDFAETFAVWLTPRSNWKKRYKGWPALKKLNYIDELMHEIKDEKPINTSRARVDPLNQLRGRLSTYYKKKRSYQGLDYPDYYSKHLNRMFSTDKIFASNMKASRFINSIRKEVRQVVSVWTGIYQYTIDLVIADMIDEVSEKNMRLTTSAEEAKPHFISLLSVQTMNFIHDENHKLPR